MTRTGYEITFEDFLRLVSDPYCLPMVTPLLKQWFNYDIVQVGPPARKSGDPETAIRDSAAQNVSKARLHLTIQADAEMRGTLYRTSQTLWR